MNGNRNDIEQFIIWDQIEVYESIGLIDSENRSFKHFQFHAQVSNKYRYIIRYIIEPFDSTYNFCVSKIRHKHDENNRKIIFQSPKYSSIIQGVKKQYDVGLIAIGKIDRLFAIKHFMFYFSILDLYQFVYGYLTDGEKHHLNNLLEKIEVKLKTVKPDYVVLTNDSLPIERSIVLVCKKLDITTIVIQHGYYPSKFSLGDGLVADYILVWGQYFKDMYIDQGARESNEIYVLGYPYQIEAKVNEGINDSYVVYYLGQCFEKLNASNLEIKLFTLNRLNEICMKQGMKFYYRPHPGDDRGMLQRNLSHINFSPKKETLIDTFNKGDIFVSFSSTSLIEASMRNKICIQLRNYSFPSDNYETLGVCSKSVCNIDDLEEYLQIIAINNDFIKPQFNYNYIDITKNPSKCFLDILNEIESKKDIQ